MVQIETGTFDSVPAALATTTAASPTVTAASPTVTAASPIVTTTTTAAAAATTSTPMVAAVAAAAAGSPASGCSPVFTFGSAQLTPASPASPFRFAPPAEGEPSAGEPSELGPAGHSAAHLTAGAVNALNRNNDHTGFKPTLQLIHVKRIPPETSPNSDRYRLVISDGTQLMPAMLATSLNPMVDSGQARGDPSSCRHRRIPTLPPHTPPTPHPSHPTPLPSPRPLPKSRAPRST